MWQYLPPHTTLCSPETHSVLSLITKINREGKLTQSNKTINHNQKAHGTLKSTDDKTFNIILPKLTTLSTPSELKRSYHIFSIVQCAKDHILKLVNNQN